MIYNGKTIQPMEVMTTKVPLLVISCGRKAALMWQTKIRGKKNWFKVAGAFSNLMACFLRGTDNHKSHRQWPPRSRQVNQVDRFKFIIVIFTFFFYTENNTS